MGAQSSRPRLNWLEAAMAAAAALAMAVEAPREVDGVDGAGAYTASHLRGDDLEWMEVETRRTVLLRRT